MSQLSFGSKLSEPVFFCFFCGALPSAADRGFTMSQRFRELYFGGGRVSGCARGHGGSSSRRRRGVVAV